MIEVHHTFDSAASVIFIAGVDLGVTAWMPVTLDRIDKFADMAGDRQWIHVDADRSRR